MCLRHLSSWREHVQVDGNYIYTYISSVYVLLGISPASDCGLPTFQNPLSVPSSKALKMELTDGSETSANHNLTPGRYPKEHIHY